MQPISQSNGLDGLAIDGNMDLPNGKKGAYDYFIRDYQENVRMILTEESHYSIGKCTMENERAPNEEPVFGQTGGANEVVQTRIPVNDIPGQTSGGGWQNSSIGNSVSRLSKALSKTVGPNSLLKVMAGDEISATAQYYYQNAVTNGTGNNLTTNVLSALVQALTGSSSTSGAIKASAGDISNQLGVSAPFSDKTSPDQANPNGNNPKAYITVLFFDERFNFISEGSTFDRVTQAGSSNANITIPNAKAPKNGYAYIYVSNESNEMVYFDNLQVAHNRGRIIEENHYYSFGLKIAGISSRKLGDFNEGMLDNKNLYNDKELIDEGDLDWTDYGFRMYDAQIGRFPQLDPLTDDYPFYTPYQYAGNEPIANIDIDGLEPGTSVVHYASQAALDAGLAASLKVVHNVGTVVLKAAPKLAVKAGTKLGLKLTTAIAVNSAKVALNSINDKLSQSGIRLQAVKCHPGNQGGGHNIFGQGSGTRQEFGFVLQGNSPHSESSTDNFVDDAKYKEVLDLKLFMNVFSVYRELSGKEELMDLSEKLVGATKFNNNLKSADNAGDGLQAIKDVIGDPNLQPRSNGIDPMFNKKGNVIYRRDVGWNVKANGDGTQSLTNKPATDTFPKERSSGYLHPY